MNLTVCDGFSESATVLISAKILLSIIAIILIKKKKIKGYTLMVYFCEGTDDEKLAVFRRVRDEIKMVFQAYAAGRRDQAGQMPRP